MQFEGCPLCVGAGGLGAAVLLGASEVGLSLGIGAGALGDRMQYAISIVHVSMRRE